MILSKEQEKVPFCIKFYKNISNFLKYKIYAEYESLMTSKYFLAFFTFLGSNIGMM